MLDTLTIGTALLCAYLVMIAFTAMLVRMFFSSDEPEDKMDWMLSTQKAKKAKTKPGANNHRPGNFRKNTAGLVRKRGAIRRKT